MRRLLVLVLLAGAILPAVAGAAGTTPTPSPFTPGVPQQTPTATSTPTATPTVVSTSGSAGGSGLSSSTAFTIAIGAIVLIVGISLFIWRDARRRAPVRQRIADEERAQNAKARAKQKPRKLSPAERRRRKRGRAR